VVCSPSSRNKGAYVVLVAKLFCRFWNKHAYEFCHSPRGPCAGGEGGCGGGDPEQKNLLKRQIVGLCAIPFRVHNVAKST
jgi:hypothetical protein